MSAYLVLRFDDSTGDFSDNEVAEKLPNNVAEKLPNNVAGLLTSAETAYLNSLRSFFDECEWITNSQAREATGNYCNSFKFADVSFQPYDES